MPNPYRAYKDSIYEQFSRIGKAIASPKRLELLDLLCQGPRTVDTLAGECNLSLANASQHLRTLYAARLVEMERLGQRVQYRIADPSVSSFVRDLRLLAEVRLAEVEQISRAFLEQRDSLEPVNRHTLLRKMREDGVMILDVRPEEEYQAGHIPGAISIPLKDLERRLEELPIGKEVVAYCRGPYCVLSIRAVELLRREGYTVQRLEDGPLDWAAHGFPITSGSA